MKKNTLNALCGTFEKVARAIAGRYDIEVVPSTKCATDGRTIYFPANADHLGDATREVLAGMNDHEVGHIREEDKHRLAGKQTPMHYLRSVAKSKKERMMMNVYEDIRMEAFQALDLIGVAENLKALSMHSTRTIGARINAPGFDNFWYAIGCAIIHSAHGEDMSWLPAAYSPFVDALADEIAESNDVTKTVWAEDSWRLAQRTFAKLEEVAEELAEEMKRREEEKADEDAEAEDGDDGEGAKGEGEQGGEADEDGQGGSAEGEDAQDGKGGEAADAPASGDEEGTGEGDVEGDKRGEAKRGERGGEHEPTDADLSELNDDDLTDACDMGDRLDEDAKTTDLMDDVKKEINKEAEGKRKRSRAYSATPAAMARDRWITPHENAGEYDHAKKAVAAQIRGMKGKLLNLIRTQASASVIGDQDRGQLDAGALHSVKAGNRRVFTRTVDGTTLDTVVSVLIDQSGSMGSGSSGGRAYYAKLMTVALAETFNALNVPFEIVGFHNDFHRVSREHAARNQAFEFQVYKAFNEKYRAVAARLGSISGYEDNADGEAVLEVAKRLAARREKRKIMFVLSDGQPAAGATDDRLLRNHLKETVGRVTKAGIEVIGIGAQTKSVEQYYNEGNGASCIVIHEIDKLAVEVYKIMKELMLGQGRKAGRGRRRAG